MDMVRLSGDIFPFDYYFCEFCKIQVPNPKRAEAIRRFEERRRRTAERYKQPYIPLYHKEVEQER